MLAEEADRARTSAQRDWAARIIAKVRPNWQRSATGGQDFSCRVQVNLLPDGTVTSARVLESCGSALIDQSVVNAYLKSSPLPLPSEPSAFERELITTFEP